MSDKKEMYLVEGSNSAHCCFELSICTRESFNGVELDSSVAEFMDRDDKELAYKMIAAPDMYYAIENALDCVIDMGAKQLMIDALAKARGES